MDVHIIGYTRKQRAMEQSITCRVLSGPDKLMHINAYQVHGVYIQKHG